MRNLVIVFILFCLTLLGCITKSQFCKYEYQFTDSPQRNIAISFNEYDSSFIMRNAVSGDLAFSLIGYWQKLNNDTIVLFNQNVKGESLKKQIVAPKTGEKIDVKKAYYNRDYIFPNIILDTLVFNQNGNSFILKGYHFKKCGKAPR